MAVLIMDDRSTAFLGPLDPSPHLWAGGFAVLAPWLSGRMYRISVPPKRRNRSAGGAVSHADVLASHEPPAAEWCLRASNSVTSVCISHHPAAAAAAAAHLRCGGVVVLNLCPKCVFLAVGVARSHLCVSHTGSRTESPALARPVGR